MNFLHLGLLLALRRWFLTLIAALCVLVPTAGAALLWVSDQSSRASSEQRVVDQLGSASTMLERTSADLGTPTLRAKTATQLGDLMRPLTFQPVIVLFEIPAKMSGITRTVAANERDWTSPTFSGLLQVDPPGRLPAKADEVVITPALRDEAGLRLGDRITLGRAGREMSVVGVGSTDLSAGDARVLFTYPGGIGDVEAARVYWTLSAPPSAQLRDRLAEAGFTVTPRGDLAGGGSSFLARYPVLFGGLTGLALLSVLIAVRFTLGRAGRRTAGVYRAIGARGRTVVAARLVEAAIGGLLGALIAIGVAFGVAPPISAAIARSVDHRPPALGARVPVFLGVVLVAVILVVGSALVERGHEKNQRSADRDLPPLRLATVGPYSVGRRLARMALRRTVVLMAMAGTLACAGAAISTAIISVNDTVSAANPPGIRRTDIQLPLRGTTSPASMMQELAQAVHGTTAVLDAIDDPGSASPASFLGVQPPGDSRSWCFLGIVDEPGWVALIDQPLPPEIAHSLQQGEVVTLSEKCAGPRVEVAAPPGEISTTQPGPELAAAAYPADYFAYNLVGAVIDRSTADRLGLRPFAQLLIMRSTGAISPDMRTDVSRIVERYGFPANDLQILGVQSPGTPVVLTILSLGCFLLLLESAVTAVIATAADDRPTDELLRTLGASFGQRLVLPLITVALPLIAGAAAGLLIGTVGAAIWATANTVTVSIPTLSFLAVLGALVAFTASVSVASAVRAPVGGR